MIEDREIDRFSGAGQLARGAVVGFAWPGVTARVVMRQHHPGAAQLGGVDDDVPNRNLDRVGIAVIALDVKAASGLVDMGDP